MAKPNKHYAELKSSYLFYNIEQKVNKYLSQNPNAHLLRLGTGDVTLPLAKAVIEALHGAVEEQAHGETFHGYCPECGTEFLKTAVRGYYKSHGVELLNDEIFISCGAGDELGNILDIFSHDNTVLVIEPTYPAYVDSNVMAGRKIIHYPSSEKDGFAPLPPEDTAADIIYICSPNNPTGAVFGKEKLKAWVDYANAHGSVIIFDAAYEAFIEQDDIPHSIFEIEGSRTCAIEICSLSKTAGFTGTRCGYTVVPKQLVLDGMNLNDMWVRNRTTKSNGVSYIIQRGAEAIFTEKGQREIKEDLHIYKQNAAVLMKALDECGIWYCGGINAPYVWFKCPNGMGSWEMFDKLLHEAQVITTPGEGFGACGEGYVRLSSFGNPDDIKEAAERIKKVLKNL